MATCGTCVNFKPRPGTEGNPYEGICQMNPPVPVFTQRTREFTTDRVIEENANGDKTYQTRSIKTMFAQPDVIAHLDSCAHHYTGEPAKTKRQKPASAESAV